jgi:aldehyde dehydrogenase (NAD+)
MAGWTEKIYGRTLPMEGPFMGFTQLSPVGVCDQITPFKFPLLMATFKIAPVLVTGCTSILKPAEQTSLSALKLG